MSKHAHDLNPQAVACMRGRMGAMKYDSELSVNGVHYVIDTGHDTRDEAMAKAHEHVDSLRELLVKVCEAYVDTQKLRRAKA